MTFDSIINRGEYLAAFYMAEKLPGDLKKHLLDSWTTRENDPVDERSSPRQQVRGLRSTYFHRDCRPYFADLAGSDEEDDSVRRARTYGDPEWIKKVQTWHQKVLGALGYPGEPGPLTVRDAGREHTIDVAWHGDGIVALDCGWATDSDVALKPDGPGRLLTPVRVRSGERYETGPKLASWLFGTTLADGEPPRFVLLLCGGVIMLADRRTWEEGRFLAAQLDTALERNDQRQTGELATIAALFSREMLVRGDTAAPIDELLKESTNNATGITGELRDGLQRCVEIIANEVLSRLDQARVAPEDLETREPIARQLTRETLRYLYRILFLLYAEARPELHILPVKDTSYEAGYSMARLRELVARDEQLTEEESKHGFHLFESLDLLFDRVNRGYRYQDDAPQGRGLRFEPLRSTLFEPESITLIGRVCDPRGDNGATLDLRLRNDALHQVLRLLTMKKGSATGDRGGFISYRNLGINQLGAVYEGLMSYQGRIAEEELCEVAKNGKPENGSWLIPAHRQNDYTGSLVHYDEHDERRGLRGVKRYRRGEFVYRLSGRERETSASYYTPESLTNVTVELTLKHRLDQERDENGETIKTRAAELLQWTICEPALGSGAFANEAINQVAEEYLRRRQNELGESISAADLLTEKQKVKAYIALHNVYGVDLNDTGVELAEVSLWLNTMYARMRAPWFGLHLRRGNSLIGARRAVYDGADITAKGKPILRTRDPLQPTRVPLAEPLPDGAVHQFLLPNLGWGAVARSTKGREFVDIEPLKAWRRGMFAAANARQRKRLEAAARRVEFLWSLVIKRMEISEQAISRRIPVWGADPDDPEFAYLDRPRHGVPKEQVLNDLFNAVDTPYWRLKTVMDAWCALWFWPADQADLLDGSNPRYTAPEDEDVASVLESLPTTPPEPTVPATQDQGALFLVGGEQLAFGDDDTYVTQPVKEKPSRGTKARPTRRPVIPLAGLDDWLDFLESLLGITDPDEDTLLGTVTSLDELKAYEDALPEYMGMDRGDPEQRFPWLGTVRDIAKDQGFLHWELEFARIFHARGGFDLQVGNPPWVRPRWDEDAVLAEFDPWFKLEDRPASALKAERRCETLIKPGVVHTLAKERTHNLALTDLLSAHQIYPLLVGTQLNLYRAFMCQTWEHAAPKGTTGLLHPGTHFTGDQEGALRAAAYHRLRIHGDFVNSGQRFFPEPVGHTEHLSVNVYGSPTAEIDFPHLSWLVSADALRHSATADPNQPTPGVRYQNRDFDERPHPKRVVQVTSDLLKVWRRLLNDEDAPVEQARLLFPVSTDEADAIEALADYPLRLGAFEPQISTGYHESGAKQARLIDYNKLDPDRGQEYQPDSWRRVILKPTQFSVATPAFKRYDANTNDPYGIDLVSLPVDFVPDTQYVRVAGRTHEYLAKQYRWVDHRALTRLRDSPSAVDRARQYIATAEDKPSSEVDDAAVDAQLRTCSRRPYTTFYRMAWRRQIVTNTERALYPALIPPGTAHVHRVYSLTVPALHHLALISGFWSSLSLDYFLRVTAIGDLGDTAAKSTPAPADRHPLASALILRSLRLNCLTVAYSRLWQELYDSSWPETEHWAREWSDLQPLHDVTPEWTRDTPLRTERARRSALVEIDALVAVWLGMSADALIAAYRGRFPVLQKYEAVTWFDAEGWKIAGNARTYGQRQTKESWKQFEAHRDSGWTAAPPEGYSPPFYKADREKEMREAHAVFQARLDAAVARGEWDPGRQEVPGR